MLTIQEPSLDWALKHALRKKMGSSIKGLVKRKNSPPRAFSLIICVFLKRFQSRFASDPSFIRIRKMIRASHPSGSRPLLFDNLSEPPVVFIDSRKQSVPCACPSIIFTNLWFLANPNPAHGMGESDSTPFLVWSPSATNQILWP